MTAQSVDFEQQFKRGRRCVFAFVLLSTFVLLLLAFRSVVIALKAIVLNGLSVAAAYGVLVLVFQHGSGGTVRVRVTGGVARSCRCSCS